jgi:biotin operon repressor
MRSSDLDSITHIRIVSLEQEAAEREAERFRELWEANDRDYLPPPCRSIPIKVWALLKRGPLTARELAEQLHCRKDTVQQGVFYLRRSGQRIGNLSDRYHDLCKYQLLPGPPLKILETPRGLKLAPLSGRVRVNEVVIELR